MDTVWTVAGIIAGAMYAAGFVMISPEQIGFAKFLFWGSAILLGAWCFIWELMTDAPMPIRVIVGLMIGTFVFVVVPETVRRVLDVQPKSAAIHEPVNRMDEVPGNQGIVTQGQKGDNALSK